MHRCRCFEEEKKELFFFERYRKQLSYLLLTECIHVMASVAIIVAISTTKKYDLFAFINPIDCKNIKYDIKTSNT